jgi:Tfp pilus assembly protein PilV
MNRWSLSGFSLIEVLSLLLVISIGLSAAVGAFSYGLKLASESQAKTLAMPTAMSLANDRHALIDPDVASLWTSTTYGFDDPSGSATDSGPVNGLYVIRNESTEPGDIISRSGATVYERSVRVDVDVYESFGGRLMASYSTRFVRQRGLP